VQDCGTEGLVHGVIARITYLALCPAGIRAGLVRHGS
jgi:hypothetical protein